MRALFTTEVLNAFLSSHVELGMLQQFKAELTTAPLVTGAKFEFQNLRALHSFTLIV